MQTLGDDDKKGWEWDIHITDTEYWKWLSKGGYNDVWLDEINEYIINNRTLNPREMYLANLVHNYYHYKVMLDNRGK